MRFKWTTRTFLCTQHFFFVNEWMNCISISLQLIIANACSLALSFLFLLPVYNEWIVCVVIIVAVDVVIASVDAIKVFFKIKFYSRISRFIDELKNCLAVCIYFFSPVWISFNNNIYRYPIELYSLYKYKLLVGLLILRLCSINVNYVQCHDNSVISI